MKYFCIRLLPKLQYYRLLFFYHVLQILHINKFIELNWCSDVNCQMSHGDRYFSVTTLDRSHMLVLHLHVTHHMNRGKYRWDVIIPCQLIRTLDFRRSYDKILSKSSLTFVKVLRIANFKNNFW